MRVDPIRTSSPRKAASDLGCATEFQRIALDCVAAIWSHHGSACAGDAEAVHQIRVAITRLRAAVAFFAPIVVDEEWSRLKREIAWLNGPLGAIRDSDVVLEYARRKPYQAWARRVVGDGPDRQQARDHRRLVRCLRSARTQRLLAAMPAWIRRGPWLERYQQSAGVEALRDYCTRELERWRKRLIRKGRHLKTLGATSRHRLRIRAKRFRYMLEALRGTNALRGRDELQRLHRSAKRLQRTLGDLRDLQRLAGLAEGSAAGRGRQPGRRPPGYRHRRKKLLDAAIAAHRDLKRAGVH